uniref:Bm1244 n=1 Tax=Brugia malayi TaxID=6279 RepID=A0A1I9G706_BRUMA|nr:Bm1244 [Brugia malayi]
MVPYVITPASSGFQIQLASTRIRFHLSVNLNILRKAIRATVS